MSGISGVDGGGAVGGARGSGGRCVMEGDAWWGKLVIIPFVSKSRSEEATCFLETAKLRSRFRLSLMQIASAVTS